MTGCRWKRREREVTNATGGQRQPNNSYSQADVRMPLWSLQIKTKRRLPDCLWQVVDQAAGDDADGEPAATVLVQISQGRKARRLVVLAWPAWLKLVTATAPARTGSPEPGASGRAAAGSAWGDGARMECC